MQTNDRKELVPCPVCCGEAETSWFIHSVLGKLWFARCKNLCCIAGMYPSEDGAIEAWNKGYVQSMEKIGEEKCSF